MSADARKPPAAPSSLRLVMTLAMVSLQKRVHLIGCQPGCCLRLDSQRTTEP